MVSTLGGGQKTETAANVCEWFEELLKGQPRYTGSVTVNFFEGGVSNIVTTKSEKLEWMRVRGGKQG